MDLYSELHAWERQAVRSNTRLKTGTLLAVATLLCLIMSFHGSWARSRDEVMAGAFRCGHFTNDREWLDCLYGAAQPARAELGLGPAPDAQVTLSKQPAGSAPPDKSSVRDDVLGRIARCYEVGEDRPWLDCYYASTQPMRAFLGLAPITGAAPQSPLPKPTGQVSAPTPLPQSNRNSGILGGLMPNTQPSVVSRMASYSFGADGRFTVTLANGQTWRQSLGDISQARWKKPASHYMVSISAGALGSTNLRVQDNPHQFKVEPAK